ncbi:hypothetical protein CCHR01_06072 [Colletotrichum chrysophilum]|uniref:Uncharacterized protein n=1 Tax=Colletotrichum chrysophilum TaxID=1836956 RepID=A0AAD9EKY9_9PEZI|nr:hypothetical protein CCHR01_06072 [Colletotrichum chrysophilum]
MWLCRKNGSPERWVGSLSAGDRRKEEQQQQTSLSSSQQTGETGNQEEGRLWDSRGGVGRSVLLNGASGLRNTISWRDCEGNCRLSVSQRGVAVTVRRRQSRKPHGSDHDSTPPLLQYYGLTFAIHSHGGSSQDHNS